MEIREHSYKNHQGVMIKQSFRQEKNEVMLVNFFCDNLRSYYNSELLDWQYESAIESDLDLLYNDGEIIASQGFIFYNFNKGGQIIKTFKSESSYLAPAFRGQNKFELLYDFGVKKAMSKNADFIWGFTALDKVWKNKLNFETFEVFIETSLEKVTFKNFIIRLIRGNKLVANIKWLFSKKCLLIKKLNSVCFSQVMDSNDLDLVFEFQKQWVLENKNLLTFPLNKVDFEIRVIKNPKINYSIYLAKNNSGEIIGYAVFHKQEKNLCIISDLVVFDKNLDKYFFNSLLNLPILKKSNKILYYGNVKNNYNTKIIEFFEQKGANSKFIDDMKFVFKNLKSGSFSVEDMVINALWTEGFKM